MAAPPKGVRAPDVYTKKELEALARNRTKGKKIIGVSPFEQHKMVFIIVGVIVLVLVLVAGTVALLFAFHIIHR
jgi:hypothetical protein